MQDLCVPLYLCKVKLQLLPAELGLVQLYPSSCCCLGVAEVYPHPPEAFEQLERHLLIIDCEKCFKPFLGRNTIILQMQNERSHPAKTHFPLLSSPKSHPCPESPQPAHSTPPSLLVNPHPGEDSFVSLLTSGFQEQTGVYQPRNSEYTKCHLVRAARRCRAQKTGTCTQFSSRIYKNTLQVR